MGLMKLACPDKKFNPREDRFGSRWPSVDRYNRMALVYPFRSNVNLLKVFIAKNIMSSQQKIGLIAFNLTGRHEILSNRASNKDSKRNKTVYTRTGEINHNGDLLFIERSKFA